MKRKVYAILVLFILSCGLITQTAQAKPAYCQAALTQCWGECNMMGPLAYACGTGCNIGYLMCGNNQ